MKIRKAITSDLDDIENFFTEVLNSIDYYNELAIISEKEKYSGNNLMSLLNDKTYEIIIAEENFNIQGLCISHFDDYLIWLDWIMVKADKQNREIGTKLLVRLQKIAGERECHKIWCDCRTSNLISKQFLKKNGFDSICEIKNHWYGQDFNLLEKTL